HGPSGGRSGEPGARRRPRGAQDRTGETSRTETSRTVRCRGGGSPQRGSPDPRRGANKAPPRGRGGPQTPRAPPPPPRRPAPPPGRRRASAASSSGRAAAPRLDGHGSKDPHRALSAIKRKKAFSRHFSLARSSRTRFRITTSAGGNSESTSSSAPDQRNPA